MDKIRASSFLELFGEGVTFETRIESLDLDSLELLEVIQQISERFGPIPDEKVSKILAEDCCTVKELFDAIPA